MNRARASRAGKANKPVRCSRSSSSVGSTPAERPRKRNAWLIGILLVGLSATATPLVTGAPAAPQQRPVPTTEQGQVRPLQRGIEALEANRLEEVIELLNTAVRIRPDHPTARYQLGRALYLAGRPREALPHLQHAAPRAVQPGPIQFLLGRVLIDLEELMQARTALDAAAAVQTNDTAIDYYSAEVCYLAGKAEVAAQRLDTLAAAAPRWAAPRVRAAELALEAADADKAALHFRAALDLGDDRASLWLRYADALTAKPDPSAASAAYQTAVAADPSSMAARLALAYHHFNNQQYDGARPALEAILRDSPGDPSAQLPLAEIRLYDGDLEAALGLIDSALAALVAASSPAAGAGADGPDPTDLDPLRTLQFGASRLRGQILLKLGRVEEAAYVARALLQDQPRNLDARFTLGTALLRLSDPEGREHLARFKTLSDAREHRETGIEYFRLAGDTDNALIALRQAVELDPDDAQALLALATVLRATGENVAALESLERARVAAGGGLATTDWYREKTLALHAEGREQDARDTWQEARASGLRLGPRVWSVLRDAAGAC